jgi:hypothetical protein
MMKLCWLPLFSMTTVLAAMPAHAVAQFGWMNDTLGSKIQRSHRVDERFGLLAGDTEELFQQRLKVIHAKEIEALRKKYGQTPGQLDQLIGKDPEIVQKLLKNFKWEELPPELQKKFPGNPAEFQEFIQSMTVADFLRYARTAEQLNLLPGAGAIQASQTPSPSSSPSPDKPAPSESRGSPQPDATAQESESSDRNAEAPSANSALGRWLLQAAERFNDMDPALRNSPVMRKAIRDLSRKIDGVDEGWQRLDQAANAVADKWARLGQTLPLDRLWPENGFHWPSSLSPQALPKWRWPQAGPRFTPSAPSSALQPVIPTIRQNDGWRSLGLLAILAALVLLLSKVLKQARAARLGEGTNAWKLGPWPVDPAAVRTREELIRAFEYLSLLRLGPAARHWHHWAIALGLGGSSRDPAPVRGWGDPFAERRQAAGELASLYEQARYAPPEETLSEGELATARRDLSLLAGVPNS